MILLLFLQLLHVASGQYCTSNSDCADFCNMAGGIGYLGLCELCSNVKWACDYLFGTDAANCVDACENDCSAPNACYQAYTDSSCSAPSGLENTKCTANDAENWGGCVYDSVTGQYYVASQNPADCNPGTTTSTTTTTTTTTTTSLETTSPMATTSSSPMATTSSSPMATTSSSPMATTSSSPMTTTSSSPMTTTSSSPMATTSSSPMTTTSSSPMTTTSSSPMASCPSSCPSHWRADGQCDTVCNLAACNYDDGDCDTCADGCPSDFLADGVCDSACNNAACNYDDGDCSDYCAPGCRPGWRGDYECDNSCNVAACNWDDGDCSFGGSSAEEISVGSWQGACDSSWTSSSGATCQQYIDNNYCTATGDYGSGWGSSAGEFDDWAVDGVSALTCPQCGCEESTMDSSSTSEALTCFDKMEVTDWCDDVGRKAGKCPPGFKFLRTMNFAFEGDCAQAADYYNAAAYDFRISGVGAHTCRLYETIGSFSYLVPDVGRKFCYFNR